MPKDRFVLHEMRHDLGLATVVGLDRNGTAIFTQHLPAPGSPSGP